jgi:hypothetical protein
VRARLIRRRKPGIPRGTDCACPWTAAAARIIYALGGWAAQDSVLKLYSMLSRAGCTDTAAEAISAEVCCTTYSCGRSPAPALAGQEGHEMLLVPQRGCSRCRLPALSALLRPFAPMQIKCDQVDPNSLGPDLEELRRIGAAIKPLPVPIAHPPARPPARPPTLRRRSPAGVHAPHSAHRACASKHCPEPRSRPCQPVSARGMRTTAAHCTRIKRAFVQTPPAERCYTVSFTDEKVGLGLNTDKVGRVLTVRACVWLRAMAAGPSAVQATGKIVVAKVVGPSAQAGVQIDDIVVAVNTAVVRCRSRRARKSRSSVGSCCCCHRECKLLPERPPSL